MIYKKVFVSFINTHIMLLVNGGLLLLLVPLSWLVFEFWGEIPVFIKVIWPILTLIVAAWVIIAPVNGMFINKTGKIIFIPDFRIKIIDIKQIERIAIIFNEYDNKKYSATVKFVYKDGTFFKKDYSKDMYAEVTKELKDLPCPCIRSI